MWTRPFNVFFEMTERGKEFQLYRVFDSSAKEGEVADWDSVLDTPCAVNVVNVKGSGENSGNTYDNIDTITPIPAKYRKDVEDGLITDSCTGDADDEDNPAQKAMFGLAQYVFDRRLGG